MLPGVKNMKNKFPQIIAKCLACNEKSMIRSNFAHFSIFFMILLVASVGITPTLSYSASLDSPRKQMLNGADSEAVLCNPDLTLMIRNNGDAACVTSSTAQKLSESNWGVIQKEFPVDSDQITALINYRSIDESRQKDGLAIIDLNPHSETFGDILQDVPIGEGVLMHHPFYNQDKSKIYNTALMGEELYRVNLHDSKIFDVTAIDTADSCAVGEDMVFSKDGQKFYLTCMGSDNILVFDAKTDQLIGEIFADQNESPDAFTKYPHGISADESIDRMIVTQTVSPALDDPQSSVSVIEFSTGKVLSTIELSKSSEVPSAPVEALFHPDYPIAYVSGMLDGTIWVLEWDENTKSFNHTLVDDGTKREHSWPLDLNIGPNENLFVSFAVPGVVNEYSLKTPQQPELLRTLPAMPGAHHTLFSEDGKYMYVQNNLLNLDGLNSGTISMVDLASGIQIAIIDDTLENGMMIESIDWIYEAPLSRVTLAPSSSTTISWDWSSWGSGRTYTFSDDKIDYSEMSFEEQEKNLSVPMTQETWETLTSSFDFDQFNSLPDRIGCPGCADNAVITIEISNSTHSKSISFEPEDNIPEIDLLRQTINDIIKKINLDHQ
jgi:DNA-binding beta-propeller fold protein YncE